MGLENQASITMGSVRRLPFQCEQTIAQAAET